MFTIFAQIPQKLYFGLRFDLMVCRFGMTALNEAPTTHAEF